MTRQRRSWNVLLRLSYEPDLKRWWKFRVSIDTGIGGYVRKPSR